MTFEINNKGYHTDGETLQVLRSVVPDARTSGDNSAVQAVMQVGLASGRIVEMTQAEYQAYAVGSK